MFISPPQSNVNVNAVSYPPMTTDSIHALRTLLSAANTIAFFGGAGVSTESGIPDFRSADGLYSKSFGSVSPEQILSHSFFVSHPEEFYSYYRTHLIHPKARPNPAHRTLAHWERIGLLSGVVTQNIDGLHTAAGSRRVAELHGSIHRNHCQDCGQAYGLDVVYQSRNVPTCPGCGGVIKPDVVLYEEPLPDEPLIDAAQWIARADTLIIAGTSLSVYPAAGLVSWFTGNTLIIINRDITPSDDAASLVVHEPVGKVLGALRDL